MERDESCGKCRFFQAEGAGGRCHRNPPQLTGDFSAYFPWVYPGWWCGEFKLHVRES